MPKYRVAWSESTDFEVEIDADNAEVAFDEAYKFVNELDPDSDEYDECVVNSGTLDERSVEVEQIPKEGEPSVDEADEAD